MGFVLLTRVVSAWELTVIVSLLSQKPNKTSRALEFRQYLNYEGTFPKEIVFIFEDLGNKMVRSLKTIAQVFALLECAFPLTEENSYHGEEAGFP